MNPDRIKNKLSHIQKCSENLEVYHTAGRFFYFWGQTALFKMASNMAANFRHLLEILKEGINTLFNKFIENQPSQYYLYKYRACKILKKIVIKGQCQGQGHCEVKMQNLHTKSIFTTYLYLTGARFLQL